LICKIVVSIGCMKFCSDQPKIGNGTLNKDGGGVYVGGVVGEGRAIRA
jgi:hypothetical protein